MTTYYELQSKVQELKNQRDEIKQIMDQHPQKMKILRQQKLQAADDLSQMNLVAQYAKDCLNTAKNQVSIIKNIKDSYNIISKTKVRNKKDLSDALKKARKKVLSFINFILKINKFVI